MRVTKAMLQEENDALRVDIDRLRNRLNHLDEIIDILNRPNSHLTAMIIALERISDVLAHTIPTSYEQAQIEMKGRQIR